LTIFPSKMPATVAADSLSEVTPLRLYVTAIPPAVIGIVSAVLPHAVFAAVC